MGDDRLLNISDNNTSLAIASDDDKDTVLVYDISQDESLLIADDDTDFVLTSDSETDLTLVDDIPRAIPYNEYDGEYTVIPILYDDQVLRTNNKWMRHNVTVKEIPVTWTTNPHGGNTVVIG